MTTIEESGVPAPRDPIDVVRAILAAPTDLAAMTRLVADDATYVSLNYDNPDLKK